MTTICGYRFACRLLDAPIDYIPSLIGVNPRIGVSNPTLVAYFELSPIEYDIAAITGVALSKYSTEDTREPILQCKAGSELFYIIASDLRHEAEQHSAVDLLNQIDDLMKGLSR